MRRALVAQKGCAAVSEVAGTALQPAASGTVGSAATTCWRQGHRSTSRSVQEMRPIIVCTLWSFAWAALLPAMR